MGRSLDPVWAALLGLVGKQEALSNILSIPQASLLAVAGGWVVGPITKINQH